MEKISDRVREVIEDKVDGKGRPQTLKVLTEIAAETWRNFLAGKQRATLTMLEAIAKEWPEYALWMATGITDSAHGHICPEKSYDKKTNRKRYHRKMANLYFKVKLEMINGDNTNITIDTISDLYGGEPFNAPWDTHNDPFEEALYVAAPDIEKRRYEIEVIRELEEIELQKIEDKMSYKIYKNKNKIYKE